MMYIFGWLKNYRMCWYRIGLLLLVGWKNDVLKLWFISSMVIVLVRIGRVRRISYVVIKID